MMVSHLTYSPDSLISLETEQIVWDGGYKQLWTQTGLSLNSLLTGYVALNNSPDLCYPQFPRV